jgi:putative transposase
MSAPDRRELVERDHAQLSIRRQCQLLGLARSGLYRPPPAANDNDLELMRRIDELFIAGGPTPGASASPANEIFAP